MPPAAPPARRRGLRTALIIVGAVVALCCIGGVVGFFTVGRNVIDSGAENAKVGQCLAGDRIDQQSEQFQEVDLQIVECGDSKAVYKVVGRITDKTQAEATSTICEPYIDQGAESIYWAGRPGAKGTVLCLGPAR